jgi:hypothetical protein
VAGIAAWTDWADDVNTCAQSASSLAPSRKEDSVAKADDADDDDDWVPSFFRRSGDDEEKSRVQFEPKTWNERLYYTFVKGTSLDPNDSGKRR